MYNSRFKKAHRFSTVWLIKNELQLFLGISDIALEKINQIATIQLFKETSKVNFEKVVNAAMLPQKTNRLFAFGLAVILAILVTFFHLVIALFSLLHQQKISTQAKVFLFGESSHVSGKAYKLLAGFSANSKLVTILSLSNLTKAKPSSNGVLSMHANTSSYTKAMAFIFKYTATLLQTNVVAASSLFSILKYYFEFIKVIYAKERIEKLLKTNWPKNSINFFVTDAHFFYTTCIDAFKKQGLNTTIIQHGSFFEGNYVYVPILSDKFLACSQREQQIINSTGYKNTALLGMPLQLAIDLENRIASFKNNVTPPQYDILILGTDGCVWEIETAYQVLTANIFAHKTVLLRHHPAANRSMQKLLEQYFENATISSNSNLDQDIMKASMVISFSVDANIICVIANKKLIYCGEPDLLEEQFAQFKNFKNFCFAHSPQQLELAYTTLQEKLNYINTEADITYAYGAFRLKDLQNNYLNYINNNLS